MYLQPTTTYGSLIPGSECIRELVRRGTISPEAANKLRWMEHYLKNRNARLTCRYFGISRKTFYRWKNRFDPYDLTTLEEESRRPRHVRQPQSPAAVVEDRPQLRLHAPLLPRAPGEEGALSVSFRTENEGWAVVPQGEIFVATFDYGVSWTNYSTPDSSRLYDIVFTDSLTGYAVGEEGVIVKYKYLYPDFVNDEASSIVNDFVLYQNFPNPFNPSTTINYWLESGQVSVKIYNLLGTHIATLIEDYKSRGNHSVVWKAKNAPSGVYYFQLNVNGKLATRKMVLLK